MAHRARSADAENPVCPKEGKHGAAQPLVDVVNDAHVPGPVSSLESRREGVDRDDRGPGKTGRDAPPHGIATTRLTTE